MAKYLIEDTTLTAIADVIRVKTGNTDAYTISEMLDKIPMGNIPSYHYTEASRVVQRLLELKALYPNNIIIATIADNHADKTVASSMTSARHAVYALEAVGSMACDIKVNLGDNVVGTNIDNAADYANAVYMENAIRYVMTDPDAFNLVGNHCKSNSTQKIYDLIGKYNSFDNYGTTRIRGFGYKDYADKKVRVIALNTCDYWNGQGGNGMSYEQKDFLMKSLDLSSKSDYAKWTIIILSHIPLDFLGGDYNKGADLKAILKAYDAGTSVSIAVNSSYANAQNESSKYSGNLTYNYSGKNAPRVVNIHGHIHTNKYGKLKFIDDNTELGIVRVATSNSSFSGNASTNRYSDYGDYSITTEEANKIKKVANSKADTSATFYFFDLDRQTIYSVGYGADIDRTIVYSQAKTYPVTLNLTNVTASNTATTVLATEVYNNTLTANSGYTLDTVTVTMGGVDVTSSVYADGVIKITPTATGSGEVITGALVITAKAIAPAWSETIADIAVAPRSVWQVTSNVPNLANSNTEAAIGVTTANSYSYTDRESKPIYVMPVNAKASDVTVTNSDGSSNTYQFIGLKSNGTTFTTVFSSAKQSDNTYAWTAGTIDYILISMEHTDGSSYAWGYNDAQVTVKFTNGETDDDNGGGNSDGSTPTYTNVINAVGTVDNVRLRSGGNTGEADGFASNYFSVKAGDIIRVSFPNGNRASIPSNGMYCVLYSDTNGTVVATYDAGTSSTVLKNTTTTGYEIHIPTGVSCSYARVAGGAAGAYDGWIVTVNEEIK